METEKKRKGRPAKKVKAKTYLANVDNRDKGSTKMVVENVLTDGYSSESEQTDLLDEDDGIMIVTNGEEKNAAEEMKNDRVLKELKKIKTLMMDQHNIQDKKIANIGKEIKEMKSEFDEIRNGFRDAIKQLQMLTDEKNKLKLEIMEMKEIINRKSENTQEKIIDTNKRLDNVERNLDEFFYKQVEMDQYSRLRNVEISGIEFKENEDCEEIVKIIGINLDMKIQSEDIEAAHRIQNRRGTSDKIIIQFGSRKIKHEIIKRSKRKKLTNNILERSDKENEGKIEQMNVTDKNDGSLQIISDNVEKVLENANEISELDRKRYMNNHNSKNKLIFINEHLCPYRKRLFNEALFRKKEHRWKFLWTVNGQIKARKNETSRIWNINTDEDLQIINNQENRSSKN